MVALCNMAESIFFLA